MSRWLAVVGLALSACGGAARSGHPPASADWSGAFPSNEAGVRQTIAAVSAPVHGYQRNVLQLTVWRIDGERWSEVPAA